MNFCSNQDERGKKIIQVKLTPLRNIFKYGYSQPDNPIQAIICLLLPTHPILPCLFTGRVLYIKITRLLFTCHIPPCQLSFLLFVSHLANDKLHPKAPFCMQKATSTNGTAILYFLLETQSDNVLHLYKSKHQNC